MSKIRTHLDFIADKFRNMTGIDVKSIFPDGDGNYTIVGEDDNIYAFAC